MHDPVQSTVFLDDEAAFDFFAGWSPKIAWLNQAIADWNQPPLSTFTAALPPPCEAANAGTEERTKAKTTMATTTTRDTDRNILHPPSLDTSLTAGPCRSRINHIK
jgi:hypothetical protein